MSVAFESELENAFPFREVSRAVAEERTLRGDHPSSLHPWPGRQAVAIPESVIRMMGIPKNRAVVDPFCGSGMTGVAAKRCDVCAYLGDVNPMATVLASAALGFPGSFDGEKLPLEVLRHGRDVARLAVKRMSKFYGRENDIGWLWARTVASPSPEYRDMQVPLVASFVLSRGRGVYLEPEVEGAKWGFRICQGEIPRGAEKGLHYRTGGGFRCILSGLPIEKEYIERELAAGRGGLKMIAVISATKNGREFRIATPEEEERALSVHPEGRPLASIGPGWAYDQFVRYGLYQWSDLFTNRQIAAIETVIDEILNCVNIQPEAVASLMFAVSRMVNRNSALCLWDPGQRQEVVHASILRDRMYMSWSFVEANPFGSASGNFLKCVEEIVAALEPCCRRSGGKRCRVVIGDVLEQPLPRGKSTYVTELPVPDAPVSDDVVDFFYVWLREGLRHVWSEAFRTLATPKTQRIATHEKLVAALRRMRKEQVKGTPSAFTVAVTKRDSRAKRLAEMTDTLGVIADMMSAGWVVTAIWPIGRDDAPPDDVVFIVRPREGEAEILSRPELRTKAIETSRAFLATRARDGLGAIPLSMLALGGALRALARVRSVETSDGRECAAEDVLKDIVETVENTIVPEDFMKQEERDESMA